MKPILFVKKDKFKKKRGAALVELAISMPLLILLTFGGVALAFWSRHKLIATNYAAIAGQMLYRECRFQEHTEIPKCLVRVKEVLEAATTAAGLKADFSLSWYQATGTTMPFTPELKAQVNASKFGESSKITVADFSGLGNSKAATDFFAKHGQAWVAEAFVRSPIKYSFIGGIAYAKMVN
jgi:TadE-like protein